MKCIEKLARSGLLVKTARNIIYVGYNGLEEVFQYIDKHLR